ncbi:hypothetical protein [Kitasatospora sp. NBC_01300]|uniref:hypothetical protein n=1 Tax=Kitasatospora sp. NBC_01300 TaxID=2903574 RepID=UPI00352DE332|nr:hypothetical protein OG556_18255 [Kitasatospora sp. NBC_01300]
MALHWHAYGWIGRERAESKSVDDELPPMEIKYWLRKPPRLIRGTFHEIDKAVDWMAGELAQYPYPESYGSDDKARLEFVRDTLAQASGRDVVWGWYPNNSQYVARALIACPRTVDGIACPEGL